MSTAKQQPVGEDVIPRLAVHTAHKYCINNRPTIMRLHHVLLIVFTVTFVAQIEANSTSATVSRDVTTALAADQGHSPTTRLLRKEIQSTGYAEAPIEAEEERFGVKDAAKMLSKGVEMKTKMKYWLFRGKTPDKILDKLKILSANDKNYKYFSSYFFKYYGRNPSARPSDLPPRDTHDIIMSRIKFWLKETQTPPQVFKKFGFTGTFESARGLPNYKYFELYQKLYGALQAKLSAAAVNKPLTVIH